MLGGPVVTDGSYYLVFTESLGGYEAEGGDY